MLGLLYLILQSFVIMILITAIFNLIEIIFQHTHHDNKTILSKKEDSEGEQ